MPGSECASETPRDGTMFEWEIRIITSCDDSQAEPPRGDQKHQMSYLSDFPCAATLVHTEVLFTTC